MNEDQLIHQVEFRWQPGKDFSATAGSLDSKEMLRGWSSRLSKLARPAIPNVVAGVPDSSFVYQTFPDGKAALIWRLYERDAMALFDQSARQPLVARALIGRNSILTPELALALCHADFARRLLPPPGQVPMDERLPVIDSRRLIDELGLPATGQLDALLKNASGIESVITTALANVGKPLSVVLPGSEMIVAPELSDALLMLWGLWRVAGPLLAPDEHSRRSPSWSFSSYEPPLGSSEASDLPIVVFRSQEEERGDHHPLSYRAEVTVRPRSANAAVGPGGLAARKLLTAIDRLGAVKLRDQLNDIIAQHPDPLGRLIAIAMLDLQSGGQEPSAEQEPQEETEAVIESQADAAAEDEPEQKPPPQRLLDALDCLHAGPQSPGFAEAKTFVLKADGPADSAERDQARTRMRARRWYIEPLILDDRWHATETLQAIVRLVVIPDLADAKVCKLLADWAHDAPVELIEALSAAAHHEGKRAVMRLDRALHLKIYQRWLREHGIHLHEPPDPADRTIASQ